MKKIGFIGLGHMGNPMAKNLLKAGFEVKVFDVSDAAVQALVAKGATAAKTIADLTVDADVLITMLQTGEQVKEVCLGRSGLFNHARPEVHYIDSSSIEVSTTHELYLEAEKMGVMMVDAPVSGGVTGAEAGTLTFMVGGSEDNFLKVKPILETMGKKIIHAGSIGHGQAAKICNNLILGVSMIAVGEAFNLAEKLGLDPKKFFEISSNASGQCWSMTSYCPVPGIVETAPSNHDYKAGFMTKMMLKDLRLGQHAAESVGATIPLATEAAELYSLFLTQGYGEMDFSGIIKMLAGTLSKTT
jgi:3-hydroxyisobutyrate dehydrogenase